MLRARYLAFIVCWPGVAARGGDLVAGTETRGAGRAARSVCNACGSGGFADLSKVSWRGDSAGGLRTDCGDALRAEGLGGGLLPAREKRGVLIPNPAPVPNPLVGVGGGVFTMESRFGGGGSGGAGDLRGVVAPSGAMRTVFVTGRVG